MSDDDCDLPLDWQLAKDGPARDSRRPDGSRKDRPGGKLRRSPPGPKRRAPAPDIWLRSDGRRLVIKRTGWHPGLADTRIERWLAEVGGDHAALADVLRSAGARARDAERFYALILDGLRRHRETGLQLRLPLISAIGKRTRGDEGERTAGAPIGDEATAMGATKIKLIPFPLARRHAFVAKVAAIVAAAPTARVGENLLRGRLARLERRLKRERFPEKLITFEIRALEEAVKSIVRGLGQRKHHGR